MAGLIVPRHSRRPHNGAKATAALTGTAQTPEEARAERAEEET